MGGKQEVENRVLMLFFFNESKDRLFLQKGLVDNLLKRGFG